MSLIKIQKDVQSVAEVIAETLKVETEIVDEESRVLGATGRIRGQLLSKRSDVFINQYVLRKSRSFVFSDPGKNKICHPCTEKDECIFTGGLFYPINIHGKCYGVISLVSFDEQQKNILLANQNAYLAFIGKMAELLGSKLSETLMIEQVTMNMKYLEAIINSIAEGIIACDGEGTITCFNQTAEKLLGIAADKVVERSVADVFPESPLNSCLSRGKSLIQEKTVYTHSSGWGVSLISNVMVIKDGEQVIGGVESFVKEDTIVKMAYRLSSRGAGAALENIIGDSPGMKEVKIRAEQVARNPSSVLITGESGTGKELFARAIHNSSPRREEPFIPINCSAIPDALLESELFGYEKGAFTGARNEGKPGLFELAGGGTVFLDEIGDMPLHLQAKILRVIQDRVVQRVGGGKAIPVDVRIIAATNQDLRELIQQKKFRDDLFFRLNVIPLYIPPLRERREDILLLMMHFCDKYSNLFKKSISGFSQEVCRRFQEYDWPGNVRELENAIEYIMNFCPESSTASEEYLPSWLAGSGPQPAKTEYRQTLQESEKQIILSYLEAYGTSVKAKQNIAEQMGISLTTLYRLMKKYNLSKK